ncbi:hypothetical protein [Streptomyces meridianus]|uniref:Translation initiation factor IF-2 n=1 Tax=Streptomyces meridianus TaxID=2938945 RepID=A0ABT0WZR0_9ACTN|nr:hypothetical protein [Streptomyces meridianus]MCM2575811.1 hypothetical protein [Streptomyces meridianus]
MRTSLDTPRRPAPADGPHTPATAALTVPDPGTVVRTGQDEPSCTPWPWAAGDPEPRSGQGPAPAGGPSPEPGGPVFADNSGRRSRRLRTLGWFLGSACACYATVLGVSLAGGHADAPWLLIPGRDEEPAGSRAGTPSDAGGRNATRSRPGSAPAPGRADAERHGRAVHHGDGARPVARDEPGKPARRTPGRKTPAPTPSTTGRSWPGPRDAAHGTPVPAPGASAGATGRPSATPEPSSTPTSAPAPSPSATRTAPGEEGR